MTGVPQAEVKTPRSGGEGFLRRHPDYSQEVALEGKTRLEIRYCVPWKYLATAAWMAMEFWGEFGSDLAITISPVANGRLEVLLDGEMLFDRKAEDGKYPGLDRVRQMKAAIREKLGAAAT